MSRIGITISLLFRPEPDVTLAYSGLSSVIEVDKLPDPGQRFTIERLIGEGTYGEVHEAFDTETGKEVGKVLFS